MAHAGLQRKTDVEDACTRVRLGITSPDIVQPYQIISLSDSSSAASAARTRVELKLRAEPPDTVVHPPTAEMCQTLLNLLSRA